MESLKNTILKLSEDFLIEAKNSISLIEDMAAMERYMAESYSGRVFIELLQNADDCKSNRVCLSMIGNDLYFANNGKEFCPDDIYSISRSGSSMKNRGESIGYRGVGFKSTTSLSSEIYINSGGTTFTFSKKMIADKLNLSENKVPVVRIPFLVEKLDSKIEEQIKNFLNQGYTTIFIFKDANINKLMDEINNFSFDFFIFLRTIKECFINIKDCVTKNIVMNRKKDKKFEKFSVDNESWKIYRLKSSAVAFKEEDGKIVGCSDSESVYHCFLPTLDRCPFNLKLNSDFSTDPSRKHIVNDDITEKALDNLTKLICEIIKNYLCGKIKGDSQILSLFTKQKNFSSTNNIFMDKFKKRVLKIKLEINNGEIIPITEYKVLPEWLNKQEKEILRFNSKLINKFSLPDEIYNNNFHIEEFLSNYSSLEYTNEEIISILEDEDFITKIHKEMLVKMLVNVIKKSALMNKIHGTEFHLEKIFTNISKMSNKEDIFSDLRKELSERELVYINDNTSFKFKIKSSKSKKTTINIKNNYSELNKNVRMIENVKPIVEKWRSSEERVLKLEKFLGYYPQDVSKMNLGYDIESTTKSGEKRYIEVKSLNSTNSQFSITNNEYTSAHQHGDNYYICLVCENKAIYIKNPIKQLEFIKRIRQWEWVCEDYSGVEIDFDIDKDN